MFRGLWPKVVGLSIQAAGSLLPDSLPAFASQLEGTTRCALLPDLLFARAC